MGEQPIPDRYAALEPLLRRKHRKLALRRPYVDHNPRAEPAGPDEGIDYQR